MMQAHQDPISTKTKSSAAILSEGGKKMPAPGENILQEIADNSSQVKQLRAYQLMADQYMIADAATKHDPHAAKPVLQAKSGRIVNHETQNVPGAVIQKKKSGKPSNAELAGLMADHAMLDGTEEGKDIFASLIHGGEGETAHKVWEFVNKAYDDNLAKGKALYATLKANIITHATPGESKEKDAQTSRLAAKNAANADKFAANYTTTVDKQGKSKYLVASTGNDPGHAADEKKEASLTRMRAKRADEKSKADYINVISPGTGAIKADYNVTDLDMTQFGPGGRLNNSDIIWNQYRLAAKEHYENDAGDITASQKKIEKIKRSEIVNGSTLATMYMTYDSLDGMSSAQEWEPEVDEFMALLGTPNARSSAFMLADHVAELQKAIDGIETEGEDMTITFETIPSARPRE